MLKKIITIRNVGRFRNSAATGNPQLAKLTLIVGANGFGKTTICAVLRSLQSGDASHIAGRKTLGVTDAASVELLLDGGATKFDGQAWSLAEPAIAIFDGVFVADNVHSGEVVDIAHKRNLYRVIIGDVGARLAKEDDELAAASRAKTGEITTATRALQPHVPTGMTIDDFLALDNLEDIDEPIADQERQLETARQTGAIRDRAALTKFALPAVPEDLADLLGHTIDDVAEDAERLLAEHLSAHKMEGSSKWIGDRVDGLCDDCPFCGQDIRGLPLIAAFRAVFGARYKELAGEIAAMKIKVQQEFRDAVLGQLNLIAERNKGHLEFWQKHCTFPTDSRALPTNAVAAARELGAAAIALLERKAAAPLEATALDGKYSDALSAFGATEIEMEAVNTAIAAANEMIAAKKTATEAVDSKLVESVLIRLKAMKARHSDAVAPLCAEVITLTGAKSDIDKRKEAARAKLDAHTQGVVKPYERRINHFLDAFNAGFTIAETKHAYPGGYASSSYQLVINNTAIELGGANTPSSEPSFKNTLSSGDRTTLALAFFLAYLERDTEISKKLVVFDDPFNSQDAFRRRQTVHEIMKVADACEQVMVLSHDATFLKQIWDKAPASTRVALTIADHRALGSKLMPIDLDKACQGRTATDIDDLQTYLTGGAGALIDLIRKMRVVLETYCRTTYPTSFAPNDWLGDMVRKIREGGDAHSAQPLYDELGQINAYTSQYHHGEDLGDLTPDQIDPTELTGFVRRTLKIVNALQA
ncbi:MAG TPA: hypothetical protein DHW63_09950 [Hyphomonadaceae bacterium]|nr:hypothetical protein [Hyphomonadaceae bacterium]